MSEIKVNYVTNPQSNGVTSFLSWNNPEVVKFLYKLFRCTNGEVITNLTIDETGIQAYFKRKNYDTL